MAQTPPPSARRSGLNGSGFLLGVALGGFFDGILLHQILQWHHLLAGLEGGRFGDLRFQILWDGVFHALMYAIAAAGLFMLWRARAALAVPGAGRRLGAGLLIGFGVWHVADSVLSHWLTGIHRIRMNVDNPLFWDLLWFAVFGLAPLALGMLLARRGGGVSPARAAALALAAGVMGAGVWALQPPRDTSRVTVWFGPRATDAQVLAAAAAVDARVVWTDASGQLWTFALEEGTRPAALYRHGAWFVGGTLLPAGCFGWSRA